MLPVKSFYIILLLLFCTQNVYAQQLRTVFESDEYTEYEITNTELGIYPAYELIVPLKNELPQFEIIEQKIKKFDFKIPDTKILALELSSDNTPVFEVLNPGLYRGKSVASLKIHLTRFSDNSTSISQKLHFKVYKNLEQPTGSIRSKAKISTTHPFAEGTWYKISFSGKNIYQLNSGYLSDLGIDVSSIDPRNIQIWGTDGYVLPERNNDDRPELAEIPIIVEGESDGSFDNNDRILFYGNSPHKEYRSGSNFEHYIHPYSNVNHVFLTIGDTKGNRIGTSNSGLAPTFTITEFDDLIWEEQELTKSEGKQKSGRYWLGKTITSNSQNQFVNIFQDTIPGINTTVPLIISGRIYLRAETTTAFEMRINDETFRTFSLRKLTTDYNSYEFESARPSEFKGLIFSPQIENGILNVDLMMGNTDSGANAFVDYLRFIVRRSLTAENNKLFIFPNINASSSKIAEYILKGFSEQPIALDVTNPVEPANLVVNTSGTDFGLVYHTDRDLKIIVQSEFPAPKPGTQIENQNLHGISTYPDYIIITSEILEEQAQELADYRLKDQLTPLVVTQNKVLNEFSNGATDPTAIRDFLKHLWDVADAANQTKPKYLLLFGDATYDTKGIIPNSFTNHVLTYQTSESIHRTNSYGSDDYFSLMDDSEGLLNNSARADLGVGRISAQTTSEAAIAIDKIKRYENPENDGDWQNLFTFAADDDLPSGNDRDLHVENADGTLRSMNLNSVGGRSRKIYFFDYPEEITGAGRQLPAATNDLINTVNSGTLVINYSGHGNTQTLADEGFYTSNYLSRFTNRNRLALFITATCQFGRYDDINAQSGAEKLVFADNGAAIASFTTTRVVYTSPSPTSLNYGLNIALSQKMLERDENGESLTFGEIYLRTKNTSIGSGQNARKFILLGDPALQFALPDRNTTVDTINDIQLSAVDTIQIKALDRVSLSGSIRNNDNTVQSDFNGEVTLVLFDAPRTVSMPNNRTWVVSNRCYLNERTANECTYLVENDVLFKGKATAINGQFSFTFIIPKDISFSSEKGRIVLYAKDNGKTAGGSFTDIVFNGINTQAINDGKGPSLDIFLNDQTFLNGSLSSSSPNLIVELSDSSGINTTGTGVGHEIIATIDTKPQRTYVLNEFYEGTLNDYTSGRIEYPLDEIPEGNYSLKVRAWDVHNNPAEEAIFFEVADNDELVLDKVYNYPNPMNNRTSFTFEHNQQGNPLDIDIRIFTPSGKPIHRIKEYIQTNSSYASIPWNGRDRDNDRLGNGTYIYVLRVATDTPEGRKTIEKIEKIVIIR